ncbi:hypothetical protein, partial [Enterobacter hormaechei]|uniref:hypothetical protein n=1 Tax=Enterobacter hormaechei TaxID=158836 RepID=UPI0023E39E23
MKLHLGSIGDYAQNSIVTEHVDPIGTLTTEDMKNKQEHNQTMLEIASALNYAEFDDIKGCDTTFKMWKALSDIYGGDLLEELDALCSSMDIESVSPISGEHVPQQQQVEGHTMPVDRSLMLRVCNF